MTQGSNYMTNSMTTGLVCTDCLNSHLGQAILIDKSYTDGILGTLKGDRFIGAHLLHKSGTKMWILAGHLPHHQQPIMDYSNAMQELNSLLQRTQHSPCLVAADWNATLSGTTLDAQALQLACLVAESKCQLPMPKEPTWKNKTYDFFLASPLLLQKIDPAASELLTPQIVHGLEALLPTDHKLVAFDTVLCHSRPRPSYRRATRTGKWLVDEKRLLKGLQTSTWHSPWSDLCHLSQACQYRLHSRKYRDSIALKQLCHTRNSTENAAQRASLTRHILQQRRVERAQWVADLQGAASSGDSSAIAFLKLKSKRHAEWSALVEASGGQHQAAHTVQQHFKNVLAHTPLHARDDECKPFLQKLHDDMQQCQPQLITASELRMAVAKLKPGKTSGATATGMSNEFVRSLSQNPGGTEQLLHLLNNMLVTGSVPQALNLRIACPIPKCVTVKPIQANQIRPIMLLEVLQKLYAGILMQRLRSHWPPLHAQIGAVPGGRFFPRTTS